MKHFLKNVAAVDTPPKKVGRYRRERRVAGVNVAAVVTPSKFEDENPPSLSYGVICE